MFIQVAEFCVAVAEYLEEFSAVSLWEKSCKLWILRSY